ncbi:hypothetical protein T11_12799 [Trichinella zimbabwensis]|uniref:Uncharacterized protein n=1 Tax=Trichinella zimbabwensis TaxID=268475 RepID=A0A0V1GJG9_9BILA|nr:hypothetical protein T11_12799 [Trichinella zimbabwensis]
MHCKSWVAAQKSLRTTGVEHFLSAISYDTPANICLLLILIHCCLLIARRQMKLVKAGVYLRIQRSCPEGNSPETLHSQQNE